MVQQPYNLIFAMNLFKVYFPNFIDLSSWR